MTSQKTWPVHEAKARFSELLDTCLRQGPQLVTRRGRDAAMLVPADQWRHLEQRAGSSYRNLKDWLLAPNPNADLTIPDRRRFKRRKRPRLDG
ncbi:MAG TPA: type II toxin-antitoxin system Phd/YefM family antitoxin [Chloroflexota bacterium]|nr:type II toxin-antitoxin system Phd/YefM family antitoxin [Chloroflexota bacterium]